MAEFHGRQNHETWMLLSQNILMMALKLKEHELGFPIWYNVTPKQGEVPWMTWNKMTPLDPKMQQLPKEYQTMPKEPWFCTEQMINVNMEVLFGMSPSILIRSQLLSPAKCQYLYYYWWLDKLWLCQSLCLSSSHKSATLKVSPLVLKKHCIWCVSRN